jgi:predicted dehydrogenase
MVHELTTLHEVLGVKQPSSVMAHGGIFKWNDGRAVPDTFTAVYEYPQGLEIMLHMSQASALGGGFSNLIIGGTKATLIAGMDGARIIPEAGSELPRANLRSWPKDLREQYYVSHGWSPDGKPPASSASREVQIIKAERDPNMRSGHMANFIKSVKTRSASVENAEEGSNAAAAAHLANLSYRQGRRIQASEFFTKAKGSAKS